MPAFLTAVSLQVRDISAQLEEAKSAALGASAQQDKLSQQALQLTSAAAELQSTVTNLQTQRTKDREEHQLHVQQSIEQRQKDSSTIAEQQSKLESQASQLADQATAINSAQSQVQQQQEKHAADKTLLLMQLSDLKIRNQTILAEKDATAKQQAEDAATKQQVADQKLLAEKEAGRTAMVAAKQQMEDTLALKDIEIQNCSTELIVLRKQLYHAGGRIDSLAAAMEEAQRHASDAQRAYETQSIELNNKSG